MKHNVAKLHNQNLHSCLTSHHCPENPVFVNCTEHITFPMDLACVNFIKYLHEDKGVEHDSEVFSRLGMKALSCTILYVKDGMSHEHKDKENCELVE